MMILRAVARIYLAPLAGIGVLMLTILGLGAALLVIQIVLVILRQLGA